MTPPEPLERDSGSWFLSRRRTRQRALRRSHLARNTRWVAILLLVGLVYTTAGIGPALFPTAFRGAVAGLRGERARAAHPTAAPSPAATPVAPPAVPAESTPVSPPISSATPLTAAAPGPGAEPAPLATDPVSIHQIEATPAAPLTSPAGAGTGAGANAGAGVSASAGAKDGPTDRWAPLARSVQAAMAGFPGQYGVVVVDVAAGDRWEYHPELRVHPASLMKMPISLYTLNEVMAGRARWSDGITYLPADFESPGGGALEQAPFGGVYSLENLVTRALKYSNNIAVKMIGRHFGWDNIRAFTRNIGGELYPGPEITPRSAAGWWLHLYALSRTHPQEAEALLQPLREVTYRGRIAAGMPDGVPVLHKFGSYNGNFHDSALVGGDHPFILIVLTTGATEAEADAFITRAARATWDFFAKVPPSPMH